MSQGLINGYNIAVVAAQAANAEALAYSANSKAEDAKKVADAFKNHQHQYLRPTANTGESKGHSHTISFTLDDTGIPK